MISALENKTKPDDELVLGKHRFKSRLILGTGRYRTMEEMVEALRAADVDMVTVAVRRVDLGKSGSLLDYLDRDRMVLLPNTAGCYTADEAVRTARLGREAGFSDLIKLEVLGDERTLLPDIVGLLEATEILAKEGFTVLPYTTDDPVAAKRLEDAGAAAVMPLAAPIGSGLGIQDPLNIQFVREAVSLPVIVDAGVGVPSDAARALELGVDGILMNTGVALAKDPGSMARAMKLATQAGRLAYLAGPMPKKSFAEASSPSQGKIQD